MTTFLDSTNRQIMGRYAVIATENLTSIKLVVGNFVVNGTDAGGGTGATSTETDSIEYPSGTCAQVKYSGSGSVSIPNGNLAFADYQTVSIPAGATFWVRRYVTNPSGVLYYPFQNTFYNEATHAGVTGVVDQTLTCGAITNDYNGGNAQLAGLPPLAILAMTKNPSVIIVGDSIARRGVEDTSNTATGNNGKVGIIAQSMGNVPFLNLSVDGETARTWTTRATARSQLVPKGSSLIDELGVNDLDTWNETAPTVITDLQSIYALVHVGQKIFQTSITSHTSDPGTPSAAWTTTGQQTAINPTTHASLNQAIRAGLANVTGFYNAASVFETSQDSDIWEVSTQCPASTCTSDGLHPDQNGLAQILSSGVIPVQTYP